MRDLRDTGKNYPSPGGRDLRDPQKLGGYLLSIIDNHFPRASKAYDLSEGVHQIPDVSKDDSMGKQCVKDYKAELESRAAEGDKYAQSALDSLAKGKGVQGYDPAGA